ncbi:GH-E family nuclease [Glycomyces sp. NPDC046736]|uniref:GH-E family nuclease n=1 Tax=Glycomyces sp. NPDC046736 TaxID=3155615 RepID=UPI0033EF73E7
MRAFRRSLVLLAVLGAATLLQKRPKPGSSDDDSGGSRPKRNKGGQDASTGDIQRTARSNAEALDVDNPTRNDSDPNNRDGDDGANPPGDLPRDENGKPIVDRDDKDGVRSLYDQRNEDGTWPSDVDLPEGWGVRSDGLIHDENGYPVRDPDKPYTSDRDKYFPSGFSQDTHNAMVRGYTSEGGQPDGTTGTLEGGRPKPDSPELRYEVRDGVPVDPETGKPIPRDRLTWHDADGNEIDYYRTNSKGETVTNVTYDHETPVVEYWNKEGYKQSWDERQRWYNDPENLSPMPSKDNSSKSGEATDGETYRYKDQEPLGPPHGNYTPKGTK